MSLLLKDRDYVADGNGGVAVVRDGESLLNETLFRLTARRGSFPFLPELGSRLHLLGRASTRQRETLAGQYVAEALADEDVAVTGVELDREGEGRLLVHLLWQGQEMTAAMTVGGTE